MYRVSHARYLMDDDSANKGDPVSPRQRSARSPTMCCLRNCATRVGSIRACLARSWLRFFVALDCTHPSSLSDDEASVVSVSACRAVIMAGACPRRSLSHSFVASGCTERRRP